VAINIKMPKTDLAMKEGKITRWFKKVGDIVSEGADLFEMETEKTTNIVQSPARGQLSQIYIQEGSKVPVKVVVAVLSEPGEPQYINSKAFKAT
jgi:pyruvate/2-oxoglutarate dehydrogenase complex dihydrolipoamide acyltransferase (E2) component